MTQTHESGALKSAGFFETKHVLFSSKPHFSKFGRRVAGFPAYGSWGIGPEEEQFEPFSLADLATGVMAVAGIASAVANLTAEIGALRAEVRELRAELVSRPISRVAVIHDIGYKALRLREPLQILIEEYSEEVVARLPEVEAFASADTEFEAIELLKADIAALHSELSRTPAKELGRAPKRWQEILTALIES